MRTGLNLGSLFTIGASVIAIGALTAGIPDVPAADAIAFPGFPESASVTIEFDRYEDETGTGPVFREASYWNGYSTNATGTRERLDQERDWLLLAAIAGTSLPQSDINRILFDVAPVRRGVLDAVATFEYGVTRSRAIGGGHVLAIVPAGGDEERRGHLSHIADEERKNSGEVPTVFDVFEYTIDTSGSKAQMTRVAPVRGETLFAKEAGYVERDVRNVDDLRAFTAETNDVTLARHVNGVLHLGGRAVADYRGIRLEDVAAIWQSEQSPDGRSHGSGFSLDPEFDFKALAEDKVDSLFMLMLNGATAAQRKAAAAAIDAHDLNQYLRVAQAVCASAVAASTCIQPYRDFLLDHRFQHAHYDGNLRGTEVGMVLFYTDLLMKLWSLDYERSTPRADQVAGFPNELEMQVAKVYADEVGRFPETRLWLGSLDKGFQIGPRRQEILFARNATRVFAVPHDSFENRDEPSPADPHVYDRVFMTWWNQHYEEVATFEREYQRLNEIMKWSQIIGWLNADHHDDALAFLAGVAVERNNRFPEWTRNHPELTFNGWDSIGFFPRSDDRSTTEALPVLESRSFNHFGRPMTWTGGVSLARREAMAARAELFERVPLLNRRATLDYAGSVGGKLRTLGKTEYEFATSGGTATTVARPDTTQHLRSPVGEFRYETFERTVARDSRRFVMAERATDGSMGELVVLHTADGFRVEWIGHDLDAALSFARSLSLTSDAEGALHSPSVDAYIRVGGESDYLVRLRGAEGWVRFVLSQSGDPRLRPGFQARISGPGMRARDVDVAWLRDGLSPADAAPEWQSDRALMRALGQLQVSVEPRVYATIVRQIDTGDYQRAAETLVADPARFRAALEDHLSSELAAHDRLIRTGAVEQARRDLERLSNIHGDRPEITLRRTLNSLDVTLEKRPLSCLAIEIEPGRPLGCN